MRNLLPLLLIPALATADARPTPFAAKLDAAFAVTKGNTVYSPMSVSLALAIARAGAKGTTAEQMDRVLGSGASASAKQLLHPQPAGKGERQEPMIAIANRIYADRSFSLDKAFLELTKSEYAAQAESVDFTHHSEAVRIAINNWVAAQTHDKIRELLASGTVTAATRAVLVDAIYLKAQWAEQFEPSATTPDAFAVAGGGSKKVPTMHAAAEAALGSHGGARMLDLPYYAGKGAKLSMLIVVPENRTLPVIEREYQQEGLAPFLAAATTRERVAVSLPKFEVRTSLELTPALEALGMTDAFGQRADFSAMGKGATAISAVVHQAWIKVDETGTEAAAATAVVVAVTGVEVGPQRSFAVDRSFMYFIHDDAGNVMFAGRIIDPAAK